MGPYACRSLLRPRLCYPEGQALALAAGKSARAACVRVGRGGPGVTPSWFRKMVARLGKRADMPFGIHSHMLRHSCGYKFANEGKDTRSLQAYLGLRNIQSTVRYTAMAPDWFKGWEND